jgi:hypothetical protein
VHGVIGDEVVDKETMVLGDAVPVISISAWNSRSPYLLAATSGVVHISTPGLTCTISSKNMHSECNVSSFDKIASQEEKLGPFHTCQ